MWADSQCDREIEESSFSDLYQESSKLGGQGSMFVGGVDTSHVVLGLREGSLSVHSKSHIGKIRKC